MSAPPTTNWPENSSVADRAVPNGTVGGGAESPGTNIFRNDTFSVDNPDQTATTVPADAWVENGSLGQVNFWRVVCFVRTNNTAFDEGNLTLRIVNPATDFSTSSTVFPPSITTPNTLSEVTFLLVTVSTATSLPSDVFTTGTGNGYYFEIATSNNGVLEIWVDSITRTSIFAD